MSGRSWMFGGGDDKSLLQRFVEIMIPVSILGGVLLAGSTGLSRAQQYWQDGQFYSNSSARTRARARRQAPAPQGGGLLGSLFGGKATQQPRAVVRSLERERRKDRAGGLRLRPNFSFRPRSGRKYRTMCVRLCDGFYFPLSFQTTSNGFVDDEVKCMNSCGAPARMYYYANPGEPLENMRDLEGNRYRDLKTAFRYRTQFVADCRCKPDPWTREAKQVHEAYAVDAEIKAARRDDDARLALAEGGEAPDAVALAAKPSATIRKRSARRSRFRAWW